MEQVFIRKVQLNDLQNIALLHKERFSDHFLGKYSIPVIREYYREFTNDCIFLVSESNGKLHGFVMGGDSRNLNNAKSRFLKNNRVLYSFDTLIRPWIYKDVVSRIPSFLKISNQQVSTQQTSIRLLSIAISKTIEGYGISKQLLDSFEIAISPWNSYGLSVLSHNKRALAFYLKNGFIIEREDIRGSVYLNETFA